MFQSLSEGSRAVDRLNQQVNIDEMEELKDKLSEQQQDLEEKQ